MSVTITSTAGTLHPLLVVDGYEWESEPRNIVHELLANEAPAVTLRKAGPRTGTYELLFADRAAALEAERVHKLAGVLTLVDTDQPGVGGRYIVHGGGLGVVQDEDAPARWLLVVPWRGLE